MNDGESFQAHACFTATASPNAPTINRQLRCTISRTSPGHNAAVGLYYLTSLEDIGDVNGGAVDYDLNINAAAAAGAIINVTKLSAFVWQIQTFTVAVGVLTLADLVGAIVNITLKRVDPA